MCVIDLYDFMCVYLCVCESTEGSTIQRKCFVYMIGRGNNQSCFINLPYNQHGPSVTRFFSGFSNEGMLNFIESFNS